MTEQELELLAKVYSLILNFPDDENELPDSKVGSPSGRVESDLPALQVDFTTEEGNIEEIKITKSDNRMNYQSKNKWRYKT